MTEKKEVKKSSFVKSFISGGVGGMCLVAVGHPFDLVKVRLQTSSVYKGAMDCTRQIVAKDGFKGLYRGMSAPITGVTPIFAICFWGYDMGQRLSRVLWGKSSSKDPLTMGQILFAGGFSAIPTTFIMAPGERIKVLLQIQGQGQGTSGPKYDGPIDVIKKLLKEGGIRSVFKGTFATALRDVPGSIAYFGAYEIIKKALTPEGSDPSKLKVLPVLFAGGMAGVANWGVAIPFDVIKSRYQSAPEGTYNGLREVVSDLLKKEGVKGLFKGMVPAMARAFPANAACFFGVEASRKFLDVLW